MNSTSSPAALWQRLFAAIYDLLPLLAIWFVTAALCLALTAGSMDARHPPWWQQLALFAVTAGYFVISWSRGGQTIGMKPWRLKLEADHGGAVDTRRALIRFVVALVSLGACGLGFFWSLIGTDRRTWHDLAAGTRLVRTIASADDQDVPHDQPKRRK
jgi:uncharacterized RDD family membrane protein YckC